MDLREFDAEFLTRMKPMYFNPQEHAAAYIGWYAALKFVFSGTMPQVPALEKPKAEKVVDN